MATNKPLHNKVALVTGGSSGMGRATALKLSAEGASLVICDLRAEANPSGWEADKDVTTVDLIIQKGGRAVFHQLDISNSPRVEEVFAKVVSEFGRLDILINCAAWWGVFNPMIDEGDDLWRNTLNVNVFGTGKMTREAVRQFLKQEVDPVWGSRGRVVSITSVAGIVAFPGEAAYCASKAAVAHLMRAGAIEHGKDSINFNAIAPGVVQSGMARPSFENKDMIKFMKNVTPWPRLGKAEDIADAILFFCLPQSQWITGQELSVDGGMAAGFAPPKE